MAGGVAGRLGRTSGPFLPTYEVIVIKSIYSSTSVDVLLVRCTSQAKSLAQSVWSRPGSAQMPWVPPSEPPKLGPNAGEQPQSQFVQCDKYNWITKKP